MPNGKIQQEFFLLDRGKMEGMVQTPRLPAMRGATLRGSGKRVQLRWMPNATLNTVIVLEKAQ